MTNSTWPAEQHTIAKHAILRRYLQAWFPILGKSHKRLIYMDAFAGPGEYSTGEPGSPVIALQTALEHKASLTAEIWFVFYEPHQDRCEHLKRVVSRISVPDNFKRGVRCRTFAQGANGFFDFVRKSGGTLSPTFAFIDPFGYSQIPMDLISRFAKLERSEVLINFMYEEINRFLPKPDQEKHFDALFGCKQWREVIDLKDATKRNNRLHDLYMTQLRDFAGFRFVRSFEMINSGNHTDYYLFYGTNSVKGIEVMKDSMWRTDPERGCQFSDLDKNGQWRLFSEAPTVEEIACELHSAFADRTISIEDLRFYVADAHFRWAGIKKDVLPFMERQQWLTARRNTARGYGKDTLLHFS